MKCPKCGYLGFEAVERCRNCGYEFSLSPSVAFPEFPIREDDQNLNPLDDLSLVDAAAAPAPERRPVDPDADLGGLFGGTPQSLPSATNELPLFDPGLPDDVPLITKAPTPRPPLAVRRATPEVPRVRPEQPRPQSLDLGLGSLEPPPDISASATPEYRSTTEWLMPEPEATEVAGMFSRLVAVIIDLAVLTAIDLVVIYFTMQICGLTWEDFGILPKGPLLAFLLVQNGGYLVAFTAGGQTLGKMATGIRVVPTDSEGTLDFPRALTRTALWLLLAVPAGLGFLTLFNRDHRGLHDRAAGTRVVRSTV